MNEMIEQAIALGVGVGQISDAMDELKLPQNAGGGYRLLGGRGGTAFGRAFTLKQVMIEVGGEGVVRHGEAALSLAMPGDILVVDAGGNTDIVTWGEGHTLRALSNHLNGVVIHGATRDAEALESTELPVLCRGTSPVRSKGGFTPPPSGNQFNSVAYTYPRAILSRLAWMDWFAYRRAWKDTFWKRRAKSSWSKGNETKC